MSMTQARAFLERIDEDEGLRDRFNRIDAGLEASECARIIGLGKLSGFLFTAEEYRLALKYHQPRRHSRIERDASFLKSSGRQWPFAEDVVFLP